MALGTIGGKLGFVIGPILAIPAMVVAIDWFAISEDSGPWYGVAGWFLFGVFFAVASGLLVRGIINRVIGSDASAF